jgi:hypothetical protein
MHGPIVKQILRLELLVAALVASACGNGGEEQQQAETRTLPEEEQALLPGEYRSEVFEPSLSFRVGEGWSNVPPVVYDTLLLTRGHDVGGLGFANLQGATFYGATRTGMPRPQDVPEDVVAWFRRHPYVRISEPEPTTVGGVKGVRIDVVVEGLPDDHNGMCGTNCVDVCRVSSGGPPIALVEGHKGRMIILEDVRGETVLTGFFSPAGEFDEHAVEAQRVIDTVQWGSS